MGRAVLGALPLCRVASAKSHHEDHCFPKPEVCCAHHGLRQYHLTEKLFLVCSLGLLLLVTYEALCGEGLVSEQCQVSHCDQP